MKTFVGIVALVAGLIGFAAQSQAQADPFDVFVKGSRVAVLPFVNYAEEPAAMPLVMQQVREELNKRSVELVTADAIAEVLRRYRVRNTNEISVDLIQKLSTDLAAAYLLVGSLDRYVAAEEGAEVALSARLIYVPTAAIEWAASCDVHTADGIQPLGIGIVKSADRLTRHAVKELLDNFRYKRPENFKRVEAVRLGGGGNALMLPCQTLVVLPFANESGLHFAGNIMTQRLITALFDAGFNVADPGRIRESMLEEGDVTPGKATTSLLKLCQEQTGADLILTGTVSRLTGSVASGFEIPAHLEVEARLIDCRSGDVVWAKNLQSDSGDGALLFGVGYRHGIGSVMDHLATRLAHAIPVRRVRGI